MGFMDHLFEIILGALLALCAWVVRELKGDVDKLKDQDLDLLEKMNRIEVLVAGNYVSRAELNASMTALFAEVRNINDKLDRKADR